MIVKRAVCIALGLFALFMDACAQVPDIQAKVDVFGTYLLPRNTTSMFRWYDPLAHYSTVGLQAGLEPGYRAYVSERLERIPHNPDTEQLDEYYVEDPGIWKLGKQYLPFGRQGLIRESARAARGDTRLLLKSVPVTLAVCDNGSGQVRGVVGRVGSVIGVSFAAGHDFAAQSTSLALVRRPEDAPGAGRGYRNVFGVDFARHFRIYTLQAEAVVLRSGETVKDPDTEVSDLALTLQPSKYEGLTLGWSREWRRDEDFLRAQAKFLLTRDVWLEPMVRMKDGEFYDFAITVEVRL